MALPLAAIAAAQFVTPLATSLIQGGKARRLSSAADKANAQIPMEDPQQAAFLSEVRRRQKALDAGTDPMTAARTRAINNAGMQTQMNVLRAQAGPAGVSNVLRAQKQINAGLQDAGAEAAQRADNYTGMIGSLIGDMSKRRYALLSYKRDKLAAEAAMMRQGQQDNLMAAIAAIPDIGMNMAYDSYLKGVGQGTAAVPSSVGAAAAGAIPGSARSAVAPGALPWDPANDPMYYGVKGIR